MSQWCHMGHRWRDQSTMWRGMNDDRDATYDHAANCITLCTDLVQLVEILKIAYGRSWKARGMSGIRKGEKAGLNLSKTSVWILYAVNCQPKALQCDRQMSFITQIRCLVVDQKLRGLEAFGCKCLYIETIYWLPITTICIYTYSCWASTDC